MVILEEIRLLNLKDAITVIVILFYTKRVLVLQHQGLPDSPGVPEGTAKNTITVPYNDLEAIKIAFENYGDDIAGIIVEPVAGNMGVVPPKDGFLPRVTEITNDYGALLIFDEVMTGFE